nr:hypothetical protein [uncultured Pseudomonas sp.]
MPNVFSRLFRRKPQTTRASAQPTDLPNPLGPMLAGLPLAECASRHAPHDSSHHHHQADCSSSDSAGDSGSSDGGSGSCD